MPATHPNSLRFTLPPATSPWANPLITQAFGTPQPERSDRRSPGEWHSEASRMLALSMYAESGNASKVGSALGIPQQTVHDWVHTDGTPQLVDDLRSTIRFNYGWDLAQMVGEGLARIKARWAEGDPKVLKNGQVIYVPASAKDETITTSILMDKWMLISGAISQSAALVAGMDKLSKQVTSLGISLAPPSPTSPLPSPARPEAAGGETLLW